MGLRINRQRRVVVFGQRYCPKLQSSGLFTRFIVHIQAYEIDSYVKEAINEILKHLAVVLRRVDKVHITIGTLAALCMKCVSHSRYMRVSDMIATAANTSLCPEISALALTLVRLPNVGRVGCVQWVYLPAPGTYNPFYLQTCGAGTNNS